jgi:DHA2 family multidrug resistance protein-like MFS transporter
MTPDTASPRRWLILALLSAAMLPIALDYMILYVAIPTLSADLDPSARQLLWIMDIYSLLMAGLVIATGPLGDRVGHGRMLLAGVALFALASLAAAFAPSAAFLVAARGLLAIGGAMIVPATLSLVRQIFQDDRERAIAIGIWGGITSGGTALGPIVGGIVLEHFWWGAAFLINLPVAAILLPALYHYLERPGEVAQERDRPAAPAAPMSRGRFAATGVGIVGIIALAYALKAFATAPDWLDAGIGLAGLLLLTGFAWQQWHRADPALDLGLFRSRRFVTGVLAAILPFLSLTGFEFALTQQLQLVGGMSPLSAGLYFLPMPLAALVTGPLGGRLVGLFGMRPVLLAALLVTGAGYLVLGLGGYLAVPIAGQVLLAVIGGGNGVIMMAASDAIMSGAPSARAGSAAAIESVAFEIGIGFGIAILGSFTTYVFLNEMAWLDPGGVPISVSGAIGSIAEALRVAAEMGPMPGLALAEAAKQSFSVAFEHCATAAGIILLAAAPLFGWMLRPLAR